MRIAFIYGTLGLFLALLFIFARHFRKLFSQLRTPVQWAVGASFGGLLSLTALWGVSLAVAQPNVRDILVGSNYDRTRVSIGVDQTLAYQLYVMKSPDRLIIDLPSVNWSIDSLGQPQPGGVVRAVRYGHQSRTSSRVIFDLFEPVYVANAMLVDPTGQNQHSLELELRPLSGGQPINTGSTAAADTVAAVTPGSNPTALPQTSVRLTNVTEAASALPVRKLAGDLPIPAMRPPAPPQKRGKRVIVLDAGHGGKDPGASKNGIREKDITLAAAHELKRALDATGRYEVHLTRTDDRYIKLRERYEIGRKLNADLFVSMHADSHSKPSARGASVYTMSDEASDKEAAALASRENKSDIIAGVATTDKSEGLLNILLDLAQRETLNSSAQAAEIIGEELSKTWITKKKPHRFAGFAVLKAPDMPSLLLEMGYVTNPQDADMLRTAASRRGLIKGLVQSVDRYFATRSL